MKLLTYNVNGIRAALNKGLDQWLAAAGADVLCLQELKAMPEQVDPEPLERTGLQHRYWYPAQKKGYSGVAIFSRHKPLHVEYGCGIPAYDEEGRVIRADFKDFSVMSVYMPSGTTGDVRQDFKYQFLDDFMAYVKDLRKRLPRLVISGDFNICHKPIDIHNPISNKNSSGFLPEERAWMDQFFDSGFTDAFRTVCPDPHHYTWWSFRAGARKKNLGWRIDYHAVTDNLKPHIARSVILPQAMHSDHCPVLLELKF